MLAKKKRADDRLDFDVQYERFLSDGDAVQSAEAEVEGPDALLVIDAVQLFGTVVKVWLSGGTAGGNYAVTVTATTAQGRVKEITFIVRVTDC